MSNEDRLAAQRRTQDLISLIKTLPPGSQATLLEESEALERAIGAFHLEGIRFRIYNVDRMVSQNASQLPPTAPAIVADVRRHLEAAGFHTRSHQAPS
jgi:hypothetical protein